MKETQLVFDTDLSLYGFIDGRLDTEYHSVHYMFYDIGRLEIVSKPDMGGDDVYIEKYFELGEFLTLITIITGHKFK